MDRRVKPHQGVNFRLIWLTASLSFSNFGAWSFWQARVAFWDQICILDMELCNCSYYHLKPWTWWEIPPSVQNVDLYPSMMNMHVYSTYASNWHMGIATIFHWAHSCRKSYEKATRRPTMEMQPALQELDDSASVVFVGHLWWNLPTVASVVVSRRFFRRNFSLT